MRFVEEGALPTGSFAIYVYIRANEINRSIILGMIALTTALIAGLSTLPADLPRIRCDGTSLVADGSPILLKGVNTGGWLVEEPWMIPWKTDPPQGSKEPMASNHTAIWSEIEKRLGEGPMEKVRDEWRKTWISPTDFAEIRAAGFNHVRIPFLASILDEPHGMALLHHAVKEAADAGLYVVLDMHGAPGGQSDEDHNGLGKSNQLWFQPQYMQQYAVAWGKIAAEFKGPEVAMFDLMNEPMGAPNTATLHIIYDKAVKAIRAVNKDTVVIIEDGYKGFETTPHPNVLGWTNVCFSLHFYDFNAKHTEGHMTTLARDLNKDLPLRGFRNAPLYIGEFNLEPNAGPDVTHRFVDMMSKAGLSWAIWTWKAEPAKGTLGQWGVLKPKIAPEPIDPFQDSEAEMLRKIGRVKTENFEAIPGLLDALTK
jgi:endoglucanase